MTSAAVEPGKPVSFDAADGSILIGGISTRMGPGLRTAELPEDLATLVTSRRDMGNGWTWTTLGGIALDGHPAKLSLGAFHGTLSEVSWSVRVAGAEYAGDWPSPEATVKEADLLIGILTHVFGPGLLPGRGAGERARYGKEFPWGSVWCELDPRAGACSSGLRYGAQA